MALATQVQNKVAWSGGGETVTVVATLKRWCMALVAMGVAMDRSRKVDSAS